LSGPSLGLIAPIRPLQLCADGGYQLRLEVLGVPLIMVSDKSGRKKLRDNIDEHISSAHDAHIKSPLSISDLTSLVDHCNLQITPSTTTTHHVGRCP
jgi:hypothetical protein